jgi:hypothetical protein
MISRRHFVSSLPGIMTALAVAPVALAEPRGGRPPKLAASGYAGFADQLNTSFRVRLSERDIAELRLIKVRQSPRTPARTGRRAPGDAGNEKFSLIFRGPEGRPLPAAIHVLEHAVLGTLAIYLGEVGARTEGYRRYEAVFNCGPTPRGSTT